MRALQIFLLCLVSVFLLGSPVFAEDDDATTPTGLGVSIGEWISPNFSGSVHAGPAATEISFKSNLGLTNQTLLVPHIWYRWAHGQILDARYTTYSQIASTTLNVPENYQGTTFAAGTPVTTSFKAQWADISYELPIAYDKFPPEESYLNAFMNIKAIRGVFSLTDNAGHTGTHPPITVPFPMVGLHGKMRVYQDTDLEFRVSGIRAGFEDALGWSYDFEGGVTQRIYDRFSITGKYRYFTFYNKDAAQNILGFRLYGPEVDANLHF